MDIGKQDKGVLQPQQLGVCLHCLGIISYAPAHGSSQVLVYDNQEATS